MRSARGPPFLIFPIFLLIQPDCVNCNRVFVCPEKGVTSMPRQLFTNEEEAEQYEEHDESERARTARECIYQQKTG